MMQSNALAGLQELEPGSSVMSGRRRPNFMRIFAVLFLIVMLASGGLAAYTFILSKNVDKATSMSSAHYPTPTGTPAFAEAFQNNSQQWDLQSQNGHYVLSMSNGKLLLEDDDNQLLPLFLPGNRSFDNFTLTLNARLSRGDAANGYGFYIRGAIDQNGMLSTYYRVELYGDGSYAIYKGAPGTKNGYTTVVDTTTPVAAIHTDGSMNQILLRAKGSTISLIVNGQVVKTFVDTGYASGIIALFVSNIKEAHAGAQATFSNINVYPIT